MAFCELKTPEALARMVAAIGDEDFVPLTTDALRRMVGCDMATVVLHRRDRSELLFENFGPDKRGIENYVRYTHRLSPVPRLRNGVARARDLHRPRLTIAPDLRGYAVEAPEEELGYRTVGWPQGLEELDVCFETAGGVIEVGLYGARGCGTADKLELLEFFSPVVASAFRRHRDLVAGDLPDTLSLREHQVARLMLAGHDTPSIAGQLGISVYTVKEHRKSIFRKLEVSSLAELFSRFLPSVSRRASAC